MQSLKDVLNKSVNKFNILAIAVLVIMIIIAYGDSLENEFTNGDDEDLIVNNAHIRSLDINNIKKIFAYKLSGGTYQPIRVLSYAIDYKFWKLNPLGYHLHSIFLHTLASIFLYLSFLKAIPQIIDCSFMNSNKKNKRYPCIQIIAFLTALLFAVHPVNVEAVTWLSSRKYTLLAMFSFLSFYHFIKSVEPDRFSLKNNLISILFFIAAAFSSPFGVVLPITFYLFLYCREKNNNPMYVLWKNIKSLGFYMLMGSTVFLMIWYRLAGASDGAKMFHFKGNIIYTLVSMNQVFFDYARNIICPLWLNNRYVDYTYLSFWDSYKIIAGLLLFIILLSGVIYTWRKGNKFPLFCFGWFMISWLPASNIIPISTSMADRYIYIASAGCFALISYGILHLMVPGFQEINFVGKQNSVIKLPPWIGILIVVIMTVSLMGLTIQRNMVWKNSGTLFLDSIKKDPENFISYTNLGTYFQKKGDVDKAIEYYRQANKVAPEKTLPLQNLGYAFTVKGEYNKAISVFKHILKIDSDFLKAHSMLGELYFLQGNDEQSAFHYSKVLENDSSNGAAITLRGNALLNMGKIDDAIKLYQQGLDFHPDFPELLYNLGIAYSRKLNFKKAIISLEKVIELQPAFAEAYNEIGLIFEKKGDLDKAEKYYKKGINENAGLPEIYNNLGNVMFAREMLDEANSYYMKAISIDYTLINARYNRCVVKERLGFEDKAFLCFLD